MDIQKEVFILLIQIIMINISEQAWTQGQMIESKYWFPCIDEPQIKFRREILVRVPKDFVVISNGKILLQ